MAEPITADSLVTLLGTGGQFGVLISVLVYFIQREKQLAKSQQDRENELNHQGLEREDRLSKRLGNLEDYQRDHLSTIITQNTEALRENAEVLRENSNVLNHVSSKLSVLTESGK